MDRSTVELGDYFVVLRRRRMHFFIPLLLVLLISIGFAFGLPPVYQSTATILIEQQEIPQELVRSTVNSYAAERIQTISKRVMTRRNLWGIIEEFNLFPDERGSTDRGELMARVRSNISVRMVSADVVDLRSGRKGAATIAFDLSFESDDPKAAQQVANKLASLFLDENIKIRTQKAAVTSGFLGEEVNRLSDEIVGLEAKLAAFKERNMGQLPEQMGLNISLMERTERELEEVERQLYTLDERMLQVGSQLAQLEPNASDSPKARLKELQMKYLNVSSVYAADHPDVVRLRNEIEALKKQIGVTNEFGALKAQFGEVSGKLTEARKKYSEDHPDVVRLRKTVATLKEALNKEVLSQDGMLDYNADPDNPVYIAVATQLEGIKINIKAQLERRDRLKEKLILYEERLTNIPRVEQEGLFIKRDYDNAVKKYHEIRQKQLQAQIGEQLERESKGERFSLIESPALPTTPVSPNRLGIMLLGGFLSLLSGLIFAAFSEFMDQTVRGAKAVTSLLNEPPLSVIPYVRDKKDAKRKRKTILLIAALFVVLVLLALLLLGVSQ